MTRFEQTDMTSRPYSDYVAAIVADAMDAVAAVVLVPVELDDDSPAALAVKLHITDAVAPAMLVGVLRQCADQIERNT